MIVPQYWAEARLQKRTRERSVTVKRFGWSDSSQLDAQKMADERAQEALQRICAGDKLIRRESRVAYNGADGVPIREELISRHGDVVLTRNSYGALCLNTPDVLFVDVDSERPWAAQGCVPLLILLAGLAGWIGWQQSKVGLALALVAGSVPLAGFLSWAGYRLRIALAGGETAMALRKIKALVRENPLWRVRLYETPAGFRLLMLHDVFDSRSSLVEEIFVKSGADPVYVSMCKVQHCFRARLTAKPWRAGMTDPLRPRRGVWPVPPEFMEARRGWVEAYDLANRGFAACRFMEELGSGPVVEKAREVQVLHDAICKAETDLPLA